jgi:uncharacterized membrane protein YedE/YeeE
MSLPSILLLGLAVGVVFGIALEKARVFEPGMILGQLQFQRFTAMKFLFSAIACGMVVISVMVGFGLAPLYPKPVFFGANLIGGLMLGIGAALSGACPGVVFAQIGAGYRDSYATLIGGLAGALAFTFAYPLLKPLLMSGGPGALTLNVVTGIPFPVIALALAAIIVLVLSLLERARPWREDVGVNGDGC